MTPPGTTPLRWLDRWIAIALVIATTILLGATADMGFTRDESFYFRYAELYQTWFSQLDDAMEKDALGEALDRETVDNIWQNNFEHPPLMKVLFGWSWRTLAVKRRNLSQIRPDPNDSQGLFAHVENSSSADGFQVGDSVQIVGPQTVGTTPGNSDRVIGNAIVTERTDRRTTVQMAGQGWAQLRDICTPPKPETVNSPPTWIAGCQAVTTGALQTLSESKAMRLPAWVFTGILLALLYLFGTALFGRWVGLVAALAMLFIPRHFFHAHLCAFDMPVVTMVVATVYAYWRSLRSNGWAIATAVIWGAALLTKHNAFFIPIPLVLAWLAANPPRLITNAGPRTTRLWIGRLAWIPAAVLTGWLAGTGAAFVVALIVLIAGLTATNTHIEFPPLPRAFLWMPTLGLAMYFLLWPWLWYDPARSFHAYFTFHWDHVHYLQQYFGTLLEVPPFPISFPFALTTLTVPIPLLALFLFGAFAYFWHERKRTNNHDRWLLSLNLMFPIALIALPTTPVFGGIKHWLPAMPFFALIAGLGFDWIRRRIVHKMLERRVVRVAVSTALVCAFLGSSVVDSIQFRRHGTAYYNGLTGGISGAADWRMHRQFWGYSGRYGLEYVNQHARRNARVAFHNTTYDAVTFYKRDGVLRQDIHWQRDPSPHCTPQNALYLFHHQESFAQEEIEGWSRMKSWTPVEVHSADGVPMLSVYECSSGTMDDKM